VLANLLGNAWKFSAGQACTEITFGHEVSSAGETVYFVRDNRVGFDMAYAEKLFGAFQRRHSQSEFSGTGIGLATVQRIIARHGGQSMGRVCPGTWRYVLLHAGYGDALARPAVQPELRKVLND
jgi:light-regulated signal transduction histidine kinase (bacteriophytochrome)